MAEPERTLEVHEHARIAGTGSARVQHSHEDTMASHEHHGPATLTIDRDDWLRHTGLRGGGRKQFTHRPSGPQL